MYYDKLQNNLLSKSHKWLITGVAGFIGSNILEKLLVLNQDVIGLDNLSTGYNANLQEVKETVSSDQWERFQFIEGDITNLDTCLSACTGVDNVLHQAALGSVPRSLADPITSNVTNVTGFLNMLVASRDKKVKSFTYASSSSAYGDHPDLPKIESRIGSPLSPYAVSKYVNELYAEVFALNYNFNTIGLRYFNVFGKRQNPEGPYAAVIPKWISSLLKGKKIEIYGDGETSRDFCFVQNAVQANILAAFAEPGAKNQVYNIALGERTTLNQLYKILLTTLKSHNLEIDSDPIYKGFRPGDVLHSEADIAKAIDKLQYSPKYRINEGIEITLPWYLNRA